MDLYYYRLLTSPNSLSTELEVAVVGEDLGFEEVARVLLDH